MFIKLIIKLQFSKHSFVNFWQGSNYASSSEYPMVLNSPEFWICLNNIFWIHQSSEYVRVTEGSEYTWIIHEHSWICLIMPRYVWTCLNIPEYPWICLNLPEWFLFYISPFPHLLYNPFSTWTRADLYEGLQETIGYSLKENEAAFLKKRNLIFL